MTILYENLNTIKKHKGIKSIRQLEISAGTPIGTIKRWKNKPSAAIDSLEKFSKYLGYPMDCLVQENFNPGPIDKIIYELGQHHIDETTASLIINMIRVMLDGKATD